MTGIIILLLILFVGTLCVVFQRPLVDFLFRYCSFGTLPDKLNDAFLSRIRADSVKKSSCPVFAIDPDPDCAENLTVNARPESGYRSLRNFVCLTSLFYGENNDSE